MKKIFLICATLGTIHVATAQTQPAAGSYDKTPAGNDGQRSAVDTPHFQQHMDAGKFCASVLGGRIAVMYKGKSIMENVTLGNGTIVFKDGTVITSTGVRKNLRDGDCLDRNGNIGL